MARTHRNSGKQRKPQIQLERLAKDFSTAMANGNYADGVRLAEAALKLVPGDLRVLADYALCLMRCKRYEEAYRIYKKMLLAPPALQKNAPGTWLDGLAEVCGWLEKNDELREYGLLSLTRGDERFGGGAAFPLPSSRAPDFDGSRPRENIIAYSLFGANPRYCESMVLNARLCQELFPGWTCRVYLDDSVPEHVHLRLRSAGAELAVMEPQDAKALPPVTWRFLVADDPGVRRFLIRDADSLLSEREQAAVAEWLESGLWFHHIRDYFTHTELILAGLWGGCRGPITDMRGMIQAYAASYQDTARFVDQYFLRERIWPTVRQSLLSHDELFGFHHARPFPPHAPLRWGGAKFHVGSNASYQQAGAESSLPDGARQRVLLDDPDDGAREYQVVVRGGQWKMDIPFFLAEAFSTGRLKVTPLQADS